jgi:predicted anti-sigma-YlaC factor YlaD
MVEQLARQMLGPGGSDAGCDRSLELVDQLIDLELAGQVLPAPLLDVARHLAACPDCREDYEGIRALAGDQGRNR